MIMVVAIVSVHFSKGFAAANGGYELNTLYVAAALAPAFDLGAISLDRALGLSAYVTPAVTWAALAGAVVLAGLNLLVRRPAPAAQALATE